MEKINQNETEHCIELQNKSAFEILSLIGKPIYAIRNYHKGSNHRNFYISTMIIKNIIFSQDGIWFDTGRREIIHESELGHRFNLDNEKIKETLEYVKSQQSNKISEIFEMHFIDYEKLFTR